jgi:hypothetical protein
MSNEPMLAKLGRPGRLIQAELLDGEALLEVFGGKQRAFALTNQRVIIADAGVVAGVGAKSESARLSDIVSIHTANGWLKVEFTNGTSHGLNYGFSGGKRAKEFVRQVHAAQTPAPTQPSTSAASATSTQGVADELAKLAQLRDRGVLTEEEFEAQKANLLSRS